MSIENEKAVADVLKAEVELAAMQVWARKLSVKTSAMFNELDRRKRGQMAEEIINMIKDHIKAIRESSLIKTLSPHGREVLEKGIKDLECIKAAVEAEKGICDILSV